MSPRPHKPTRTHTLCPYAELLRCQDDALQPRRRRALSGHRWRPVRRRGTLTLQANTGWGRYWVGSARAMPRGEKFAINLRELSGALGDLGTLLPLMLGAIAEIGRAHV